MLSQRVAASVSRRPWLLLPILAIPALWSFYSVGFTDSDDGLAHLFRVVLLDYHLRHGTLYPRWFPELRLGNGYPVFNFYGPLTYYLAEGWHLIGLNYFHALQATLALLVIGGGCGMYFLARDVYGRERRWGALVAAVAYIYAPYLLTNVFVRGAVAEVGAQALLPWLLWSARRIMRAAQPATYLLPLALFVAALALTHNISLLLGPPVVAGYALVLWWQAGRPRVRLAWLVLGGLLAMGATAFFWLPLIAERGYLADQAYRMSAQFLVPTNAWRWENILGTTLAFAYTFGTPQRLGLVQTLLAVTGFLLARRRDAEWLFFACLAILAALLIGAWAVPLWLSSPVLLTIQFPWRLLGIVSLPLALFTGGIVLPVRRPRPLAVGTLAILSVTIVANMPRLVWINPVPASFANVTVAQAAQKERAGGLEGSTFTAEFLPRWVVKDHYRPTAGEVATPSLTPQVLSGNDYSLEVRLTGSVGGALRFATHYYPTWQVLLDGAAVLPAYASTGIGLLTVDVPPGTHTLNVGWVATRLQRVAEAVSLLSLLALAWLAARQRQTWLALILLVPVALAVAALVWPAPLQIVHAPAQPLAAEGIQLVGYRAGQERPGTLSIYPYWYVSSSQPKLQLHWQLRDAQGRTVVEIHQQPYYNSASPGDWPPGTLADDAYELSLPSGLPLGSYELYAQLETAGGTGPLQRLGAVALREPVPAAPSASQPDYLLQGHFGPDVSLVGYDMRVNRVPVKTTDGAGRPVVVHPGDQIDYTLYWRAEKPLDVDYSAWVEMVNGLGRGTMRAEHLVGAPLYVATSWDSHTIKTDHYRLVVPADAQSDVHSMELRFYDPDSLRLIDFIDKAGRQAGDHVALRPVKVLREERAVPRQPLDVHVDRLATVVGYDLDPATRLLCPGSELAVTLHYRVEQPTSTDYTRFLHLASPVLGTAAQQDGPPRSGGNPTSAWLAGEAITDTVRLAIASGARPGDYLLTAGFYDLQTNLARAPLHDANGQPLPDNQFSLGTITVCDPARTP